jgi:outer membrane lipoprotein-sorting protein
LVVGFFSDAISLDNELGQIITIIFEQLVVNPAITPKTFELNIDSSFDVIKCFY